MIYKKLCIDQFETSTCPPFLVNLQAFGFLKPLLVLKTPGLWDKIAGQMPRHVERFEFKCPLPRD